MRLMAHVGAWALCCFHCHTSTQTFRKALTASVDSCAEIKSAPSVAKPNLAEFQRKVPESDARSVAVNVRARSCRSCVARSLILGGSQVTLVGQSSGVV